MTLEIIIRTLLVRSNFLDLSSAGYECQSQAGKIFLVCSASDLITFALVLPQTPPLLRARHCPKEQV